MNNTWIFYNKENNLWKFDLKKNGDFIYNIMYSEDRWTNENKIDTNVLDFKMEVDKEENIHIIYSKKGQLKYCIWNREQWLGKILYEFEDKDSEIREITLVMLENNINAFFILKSIKNPSVGTLMHYILGKDNATINTIQEIMLIPNVENHYHVEIVNKNNIYVFFINNQQPEIEVKNFIYENSKWSVPKKLYDIKGSNIDFCTMLSKDKIHILNLSKEQNIYSLEAVYIDINGEMRYSKLFEGEDEIINPILIEKENILWAMWRQGKDIICDLFEEEWNPPFKLDTKGEEEILLYNCIFGDDDKKIKGNKLLGTNSEPIKFFVPDTPLNMRKKYGKLPSNAGKEKVSNVSELKEFKELEDIIYNLKLQLKQKESIITQLEEQISNVVYKNKRLQEKSSIFKQIYEEAQEGLKERKKQLDELQEKLDSVVNENQNLNLQIEELNKDKEKLQEIINEATLKNELISEEFELTNSEREELEESLEKAIIENKTIKESIKSIIKEKEDIQDTLETIKKQLNIMTKEKEDIALMLKQINNEKIKLQRELEEEMNKSIISKILGRRDEV
ncbi:MAG: hypothetical protein KID00_02670 [Clostridium argentinense]|nr:hypothetical protein [Clostridium argentinense]